MMKQLWTKFSLILSVGLGLATLANAEESAAPKKKSPTAEEGANSAGKVRYKKRSQVDFSSQTVEGKMRRPETSLVTASESVVDQGILRLRENFMDKIAVTSGEDVK